MSVFFSSPFHWCYGMRFSSSSPFWIRIWVLKAYFYWMVCSSMPIWTQTSLHRGAHQHSSSTPSSPLAYVLYPYFFLLSQVIFWRDMFPSSSSLPTIPSVPLDSTAAELVTFIKDVAVAVVLQKARRYPHAPSNITSASMVVTSTENISGLFALTGIVIRYEMTPGVS